MANGIDWFRWHHGSITDPKFQLIARKSGQRLGDVIAVWAYLLESASAAETRGTIDGIDCEAVDCLIQADEGTTAAIMDAMTDRGLIKDGLIVSWQKRQPKREREDDKSTARVQAFRERQRQSDTSNALERQETPREEKSREEERRVEERRGEQSREETLSSPRSEKKQRQPKSAYSEDFESAWQAYPSRPGSSKADALKAWSARLAEGVDPELMIGAVKRYAAFCKAMGTEPQYIKQPSTFFGPGGHIHSDWTPPAIKQSKGLDSEWTDFYRNANSNVIEAEVRVIE